MADLVQDDPSSGVQSSSEDQGADMPVESLVQGRVKRSTAGRHMAALIDAAADDDLTLLFEEVEDDQEFAMDGEVAEEEDVGLDSSSDDDDDQGPAAQNDYEGEKELQKEERKKRRAQNDLRFQTLRKRVKIDPTAVSSVPAPPPRPKKKSERLSWLPTVEDGPTRSSSRRQTMVNKELTHARLKDSQEKRIRIIATMKEAEKRKAHLKPKEMTQEDHLAEAARVERTNSKSLNRWELSEKKKAEERKAKIEALQNRRLEGPVISYWSGVATWVDGKLTKVGRVEVKAKPEKEEPRKKKKEKDEKSGSEAQGGVSSVTPGPAPDEKAVSAIEVQIPGPTVAAAETGAATESAENAPHTPVEVVSEQATTTVSQSAVSTEDKNTDGTPAAEPAGDSKANAEQASQENQIDIPNTAGDDTGDRKASTKKEPVLVTDQSLSEMDIDEPPTIKPEEKAEKKAEEKSEEISEGEAEGKPEEEPDAMDLDPKPDNEPAKDDEAREQQEQKTAAVNAAQELGTGGSSGIETDHLPSNNLVADTKRPANDEVPAPTSASASASTPVCVPEPVHADLLASEAPEAPKGPQSPHPHISSGDVASPPATSADGAASAKQDLASASDSQQPQGELGNMNRRQPTVSQEATPTAGQPEIPSAPAAPPVIEHTGRILTILENFDDRTAHSKKYSMYFNAKKPPRLTKISSSLCVITSLPSRYRDPETSLPYANSFAYKQIRRMLSQGYIWSSMLGCFVGPGGTAARGVPGRVHQANGTQSSDSNRQTGAKQWKAQGSYSFVEAPLQ
ncbi:hypothetical protein PDE_06918 [Penicillium oxalicum 114-2]|uniref:Vps72/YL1 C-terminal domain-containing protein n=1 Tax=Penicillium oxalicum (strain 114-2 / CGMCC 5302) TaxID=933388 RepID=S7ZNM2_PENO1|nr:hypothetical protein PDE_06918 [Penicillium oxalicum 114-2]